MGAWHGFYNKRCNSALRVKSTNALCYSFKIVDYTNHCLLPNITIELLKYPLSHLLHRRRYHPLSHLLHDRRYHPHWPLLRRHRRFHLDHPLSYFPRVLYLDSSLQLLKYPHSANLLRRRRYQPHCHLLRRRRYHPQCHLPRRRRPSHLHHSLSHFLRLSLLICQMYHRRLLLTLGGSWI